MFVSVVGHSIPTYPASGGDIAEKASTVIRKSDNLIIIDCNKFIGQFSLSYTVPSSKEIDETKNQI